MMFSTKFRVVGLLGTTAVLLAACASTEPPRELVDARAAFIKAQQGPAGQLKPAPLIDADKSLKAAEQAFAAQAEEDRVKALAYRAERKSEEAEVVAQDVINTTEQKQAENQIQQITQQQLSHVQGQLGTSEQQRIEAEARAREALDRLGNTRQDSRGIIVTLPSEVLFMVGKSSLLPAARSRLDEVATALKSQEGHKITVEGFTDSTGSEDLNDRLSRQRAEAVRDYLISQGLPADRVEAKGFGEGRPVASNGTAVGRAMNRRVEIVIEKSPGGI